MVDIYQILANLMTYQGKIDEAIRCIIKKTELA